MAILITSACIRRGACEPRCPNKAIYEQEAPRRWADATTLTVLLSQPCQAMCRYRK
jgi:ferredoxin